MESAEFKQMLAELRKLETEKAELLAACKKLLAAYADAHSRFDLGECEGSIMAYAAIAKAEGRAG